MKNYIGRRYDTLERVCVQVNHGQIVNIETAQQENATGPLQDFLAESSSIPWIAPGLFDIQINGNFGQAFSSKWLTEDHVAEIFHHVLQTGVFRFCPTVTTNAPDRLIHSVRTIASALEHHRELEPMFAGIHLEGPFISKADGPRGAHPLRYCQPYDKAFFAQLQQAARGRIRIVTLSPEYENSLDFIQYLLDQNIHVSIGHTNASPLQIAHAVDAGVRLSTHLGNASHPFLPKKENYFFSQLVEDRLTAGIIADGFHLSPMMLQLILRTKGHARLILVSDCAEVAGLPAGIYETELCNLEICSNGKIVFRDNPLQLSGASFPVHYGLVNMMHIGDLTLEQAFELCTTHPATQLHQDRFSNGNADFLQKGKSADFLLFTIQPPVFGPCRLADTNHFQSGKLVFQSIVYQGKEIPPA